jgi:hypothetical protein
MDVRYLPDYFGGMPVYFNRIGNCIWIDNDVIGLENLANVKKLVIYKEFLTERG